MTTLQGQFADAIIYSDTVDEKSLEQIQQLLNQAFVQNSTIRVMSDVHAGKGCTIGFTMTIQDKVCPNLVGVDIGCGMLTVKLKEKDLDLAKIDAVIHEKVPAGINTHQNCKDKPFMDNLLGNLQCFESLKHLSRHRHALGTLGGGNHFIEIGTLNGDYYLVIHTGSRNLGKQVAELYQKFAIAECSKDSTIENSLAYLQGESMQQYLSDVHLCQSFAVRNRREIANIILQNAKLTEVESFETVHNYIDSNNYLRKGAIAAYEGEKVLIPMNMRDGSILATGKGNKNWNYSAPHGAGRLMSRTKALEVLSLEDYKESMKDIFSTCVTPETLDEAPMAYKPMDEILTHIHETVDVIGVIKPVYNFKSSETFGMILEKRKERRK